MNLWLPACFCVAIAKKKNPLELLVAISSFYFRKHRETLQIRTTSGDKGSWGLKLEKTVWQLSIHVEVLLKSVLNYVTQGKCHCSENLQCQQVSGQITLQDKHTICHPHFQKAKLPPTVKKLLPFPRQYIPNCSYSHQNSTWQIIQ